MKEERESTEHPAFGMLKFSRNSCGGKGQRFFGSELPQNNYITLSITNGVIERDLSNDWFYEDHKIPLIEVRMSQAQFAEAITSMNMGCGVPVTLQYVNRERVVDLPEAIETKKEFTHRKFQERMVQFGKTLLEKQELVKTLTAKKTLSKDDQRELNWAMEWIQQEVTKNIPFFAQVFQEQMDNVVSEAKMEIEAAMLHKVANLGLKALAAEQNGSTPEVPSHQIG